MLRLLMIVNYRWTYARRPLRFINEQNIEIWDHNETLLMRSPRAASTIEAANGSWANINFSSWCDVFHSPMRPHQAKPSCDVTVRKIAGHLLCWTTIIAGATASQNHLSKSNEFPLMTWRIRLRWCVRSIFTQLEHLLRFLFVFPTEKAHKSSVEMHETLELLRGIN